VPDSGAAYVYYGCAIGVDPEREDYISPSDRQREAFFGYSVAGLGDVDGDGYDDVGIGAKNDSDVGTETGTVYLYHGGSAGLLPKSEVQLHASDAMDEDHFGRPVDGAGDVNADGYADLVTGAKDVDNLTDGSGAVYVYLGSATGIDATTEAKFVAPDGRRHDYFGAGVDGAGDLDADGYDDIVVGCSEDDDVAEDAGAIYLLHGSVTGVSAARDVQVYASDGEAGDKLGSLVAGLGDLDGDGLDDVLVSAFFDDDVAEDAGAVYMFRGCVDADADGACERDDCDDTDPTIINGTWHRDGDGDGFGDPNNYIYQCDRPKGYVANAVDCDDRDAKIGAAETWYLDADGDGWGEPGSAVDSCELLSGHVLHAGDCDDGDAAVSPDAEDPCGDGLDTDCDGLGEPGSDEDGDEAMAGTDPADADSDDDGLDDGEEAALGTDPLDTDSDDDGLSDSDELSLGTEPTDADSDDDGINDGDEQGQGTDPLDADSDDDGLSDGDEAALGTDPLDADSDDDGLSDGDERDAGSDPNDPDDPGEADDTAPPADDTGEPPDPRGPCGCTSTPGRWSPVAWLLLGLALAHRRRDQRGARGA
jgi:hypothetical protein